MLGIHPFLDLVVFPVQNTQLPALKKLWKEEEPGRDTQKGHEGECNGDCLYIHDTKYATEEEDLEESIFVDAVLFHVLGIDSLWIAAWLLKEEEEPVPELDSR